MTISCRLPARCAIWTSESLISRVREAVYNEICFVRANFLLATAFRDISLLKVSSKFLSLGKKIKFRRRVNRRKRSLSFLIRTNISKILSFRDIFEPLWISKRLREAIFFKQFCLFSIRFSCNRRFFTIVYLLFDCSDSCSKRIEKSVPRVDVYSF